MDLLADYFNELEALQLNESNFNLNTNTFISTIKNYLDKKCNVLNSTNVKRKKGVNNNETNRRTNLNSNPFGDVIRKLDDYNNNSSNIKDLSSNTHTSNSNNTLNQISYCKLNLLEGPLIKQVKESNFHNKAYNFNNVSCIYPLDKNRQLTTPLNLNSKNIFCNTFKESDLNNEEYSIIPKDQDSFLSSYKEYFAKIKDKLIEEDLKNNISNKELIEERIFILVVVFDSTSFDINEISLVDPCKEFKRYQLKFDDCENLKNFEFFNGQIVKVEGILREKEIYPINIINGFPLISYMLVDSNVNNYFKESAAYAVYAMNGPFFNDKEIDFTVFSRCLNKISQEEPHVLIIGGPFVPLENEVIQSGHCIFELENNQKHSFSFFELFQMFLEKINEYFKVKE